MLSGVSPGHGDFSLRAINVPVEVFGMAVAPGDIVHMDENGAVKFPVRNLDQVLANCKAIQAEETEKQAKMRQATTAEALGAIFEDKRP